jgi:hypothetical protein
VDTSKLDSGIVQYKASDGQWLGFHWQDNARNLGVWRNGKRHDFQEHARYLYRNGDGGRIGILGEPYSAPIYSKWGEGTLYVEAGGEAFASTVSEDGRVTFHNGKPKDVRAKLIPGTPLESTGESAVVR